MKFRLLFGHHVADNPEDLHLPGGKRREVRYNQGAIIESSEDLCQLNGRAGDAKKFELLGEMGEPTTASPLTFDPRRESLEQFSARMVKMGVVPNVSGAPLPNWKPDPTSYASTPHPGQPAQVIQQEEVPQHTFPSSEMNLDAMTLEQLWTHAEAEEIAIPPTATDKASILKIIRAEQSKMVGASR
jgi:hypothetical protein